MSWWRHFEPTTHSMVLQKSGWKLRFRRLKERARFKHQLHGNAIPDAWIAAAVKTRRFNLATFDRDFRRYLLPTEWALLSSA